jgi:hypothetical protein
VYDQSRGRLLGFFVVVFLFFFIHFLTLNGLGIFEIPVFICVILLNQESFFANLAEVVVSLGMGQGSII